MQRPRIGLLHSPSLADLAQSMYSSSSTTSTLIEWLRLNSAKRGSSNDQVVALDAMAFLARSNELDAAHVLHDTTHQQLIQSYPILRVLCVILVPSDDPSPSRLRRSLSLPLFHATSSRESLSQLFKHALQEHGPSEKFKSQQPSRHHPREESQTEISKSLRDLFCRQVDVIEIHLDEHVSNKSICEQIEKETQHWFGPSTLNSSMTTRNDEYHSPITNMNESNDLKGILNMLQTLGESDLSVAIHGFQAIAETCGRNIINKEVWGESDAFETIVRVMHKWLYDDDYSAEQVVLQGLRAIYQLNDKRFGEIDVANRQLLGRDGICEIVCEVLKTLGPKSNMIAREACLVLFVLARFPPNNDRIGLVGGCKAVVEAMRIWGLCDANTAEQCCALIGNLAVNHESNQQRLGVAGACPIVVGVLKKFGPSDARAALAAGWAIANLAASNVNKKELNGLGASKFIKESISARRELALRALS